MTGLRLPLRLARREVRRRPGRTALVGLLVAIPVLAMALAVTLFRTDSVTPEEAWARQYGQAEAVGQPGGPPPSGSRSVVVRDTFVWARTEAGRTSDLQLSDHPLLDPIMVGFATVVQGRAPTAERDLVLSRAAAKELGVEVGEELVLSRPALRLELVGLVEEVDCISCRTAIVTPAALSGMMPAIDGAGIGGIGVTTLVDLPHLTEAQQVAVESSSDLMMRDLMIARAPEYLTESTEAGDYVLWTLILGGVVLTVVGIVISAAFAVGARRQLVTLGQLSASGAPPSLLRATLVLQGTVTGLVGAVAGLGLAAAVLAVGHDRFELLLNQRFGPYDVPVTSLAKAALLGVVAATLAALVPARTAARIPTLSALAGRRPQSAVPAKLVAGGIVAVAIGLGLLGIAIVGGRDATGGQEMWAYVGIAGGVLELLGACALAPVLVARLEPLAGRLRGAWRMGARGLARNRARTGAVVSAVSAAGALAILTGALVQGAEAQQPDDLEAARDVVVAYESTEREVPSENPDIGTTWVRTSAPPAPAIQDALETALPEATASIVRTASPVDQGDTYWDVMGPVQPDGSSYGRSYQGLVIADDPVLDAVGASEADREVLEDVGLVQLVAVDGGAPISAEHFDAVGPSPLVTIDGQSLVVDHSLQQLSDLLITEERATALGLEIRDGAVLYDLPADVTGDQSRAVEDIQVEAGLAFDGTEGEGAMLTVGWHRGDSGPSPLQLELLLTGLALVFALFVVGASLALAAAEAKDERDILTIAGAPPGLLARAAGARAWILAGLGGLLAVPVGFLPVIVFTEVSPRPGDTPFPLVFPSRTALILVLVVPTIVMLVARSASAASLRLRPVRVSTATFE